VSVRSLLFDNKLQLKISSFLFQSTRITARDHHMVKTSMLANGSKFSLEIQLLQSSPPVVKTMEVTETWLEV